MTFRIRDFELRDAASVNDLAVAAFAEFREEYEDWSVISRNLARTAELAAAGELIVAESAEGIVGSVTYVGPGKPKQDFFELEWPVIRMLVVRPSHRGQGIGR